MQYILPVCTAFKCCFILSTYPRASVETIKETVPARRIITAPLLRNSTTIYFSFHIHSSHGMIVILLWEIIAIICKPITQCAALLRDLGTNAICLGNGARQL